jgi:hypothetical protein
MPAEGLALIVKVVGSGVREADIGGQWAEDVAYYRRRGGYRTLVGLVYDGEGLLIEPNTLETAWSLPEQDPALCCVIAQ